MSKTQNSTNKKQQEMKLTKQSRNKPVENTKKHSSKEYSPPSELYLQLMPFLFILIAFFLVLCLFATSFTGWLGEKTKGLLAGLFSWGAYLLPVILVARAFCHKNEATSRHPYKNWILSFAVIIIISAIVATAKVQVEGFNPIEHFKSAINDGTITTGSLFGGMLSNAVRGIIGRIMTFIILIISFILLVPFTVNRTPADLFYFMTGRINIEKERAEEKKRQREEYFAKKEAEEAERRKKEEAEQLALEKKNAKKNRKEFNIEVEGPGEPAPDIDSDSEIVEELPEEEEEEVVVQPEIADEKKSSLKSIFSLNLDPQTAKSFDEDESNLEEIEAETDIPGTPSDTDTVEDTPEEEPEAPVIEAKVTEVELGEPEEEAAPEYQTPPVHLLKMPVPITSEMNSEYEQTAKKLVDTLASFGVKTKIINIAKGPTVTRYELQPEIGVRVRSIRNLADDIALSLAAKGVRIEAPIPGKEAVGIEVPNKNTSIVSIRSLIESPTFANAKSKLTTCLGVDVAGNPVYCDISKMPHMMIAGTTGSGKSVCINSILVSILYKARPDEVKLILIDPKKIELGVYNGIAHLLVPVVSDPKNAAGALAWSVNEMERRFALIEETGVRDIKAYNEVALRDGNREVLPHIVIIIDELADLMMMARDTVESSIARIAQKARAAGMHLVIGTQRPSVDVITGLIKANVPSRIAFTVASQVDSRTIIDVVGAEKLVGKGDMLYSPVGAMTPMRVQGAFVSDSEIESVISFLKGNSGAEYDEEIMDSIEKEAAKCEKSKSKASDGDEEFTDDGDNSLNSDPMLRPAIEIAIDSGTISTSMLQRRLKLGYARAARLIDKMEALGIVSEFAGSKPRTVLISYEKYMEMVANSES